MSQEPQKHKKEHRKRYDDDLEYIPLIKQTSEDSEEFDLLTNKYFIIGVVFLVVILAILYYMYRDLTLVKNTIKQNTILEQQLIENKNTMLVLEQKLNKFSDIMRQTSERSERPVKQMSERSEQRSNEHFEEDQDIYQDPREDNKQEVYVVEVSEDSDDIVVE